MKAKSKQSNKKLRGGYYTDLDIATFLSKWAIDEKQGKVLEPGCGDGVFFEALNNLNNSSLNEVVGFEIDKGEAIKARNRARGIKGLSISVKNKDYLNWSTKNEPLFDAVVGNPPFVRYQYLSSSSQKYAKSIFDKLNLNFTRHTNLWVSFLVSSFSQLKPGGRLAMVVPSEILHVKHSKSLRNFLTENSSRVLIFDPKELWFDGILQGAILLMVEKKHKKSNNCKGVGIKQTKTRDFLKTDPEQHFSDSDYVSAKFLDENWMPALLNKRERKTLLKAQKSSRIYKFNDIADVSVGIVTGANNFFLVEDSIVNKFNLSDWAYPMFGRSKHVPGIVYNKSVHNNNKKKGLPTNFLWFKDEDKKSKLPKKVLKYIDKGEKKELNKRYKCRIRDPWYKVPSVYSTPLSMLKRAHNFPRLIYNEIEAFTTDTAYRISNNSFPSESLAYSFVNSLTALSAELEGRHYGGGVLELVPSEIKRLLIPKPKGDKKDLYSLDKLIQSDKSLEYVLKKQDEEVLVGVGLNSNDRELLYNAWKKLKSRRQRN